MSCAICNWIAYYAIKVLGPYHRKAQQGLKLAILSEPINFISAITILLFRRKMVHSISGTTKLILFFVFEYVRKTRFLFSAEARDFEMAAIIHCENVFEASVVPTDSLVM